MSALRWEDAPSSDHLGCVPIPVLRVPKAGKRDVWLLAPFRGLPTHYVKGRSYACVKQDCAYCGVVPVRRKGYAPVAYWRQTVQAGQQPGWFPAVQEITAKVIDLVGRRDLVGKLIRLERQGKKHNGPLTWDLSPDSLQPKVRAPFEAFDPEPILLDLWDMPGRDQEPPVTAELPEAVTYPEPRPAWAPATIVAGGPTAPPTPEELARFQSFLTGFGKELPANGAH